VRLFSLFLLLPAADTQTNRFPSFWPVGISGSIRIRPTFPHHSTNPILPALALLHPRPRNALSPWKTFPSTCISSFMGNGHPDRPKSTDFCCRMQGSGDLEFRFTFPPFRSCPPMANTYTDFLANLWLSGCSGPCSITRSLLLCRIHPSDPSLAQTASNHVQKTLPIPQRRPPGIRASNFARNGQLNCPRLTNFPRGRLG